MTTYLSEESANALLTLVKEAKTSGSYDDKINKLTKSGILAGGQTYSNRAAEVFAPGYPNLLNGGAATFFGSAAGFYGYAGALPDMASVRPTISLLNRFITIVYRARETVPPGAQARFRLGVQGLTAGNTADPAVLEALGTAAGNLDVGTGNTAYVDVLVHVIDTGLVSQLAKLHATKDDVRIPEDVRADINESIKQLEQIGVRVEDIIKQGPAYLSTIPDGTYSFTVNQVNTTQPDIITGTAVISSQYDRYTGIPVQKLINNTIVGAVPITALQTLDAYYNSIQVDTSGSSYNGKYTVTGNTATITSYGYSQAAGEFVETVTTIISTIFSFSFYVINSIINPDKSQTIISLTIYTRQLKSAEIIKVIDEAFMGADKDKDGFLTPEQAVEAGMRLAAFMPRHLQFDAARMNTGHPITGERFNMAFALIPSGGIN